MHRLRYFSLFVCLLAVCISARAQTGSAAISGRVADHSGAVIQKAEVSIKNIDTGTSIASKTNNDGIYTFPSVKPGNYVMRVEKQGFRSVDVTGLTVYTQDQLARNFSLEVGSASESITVTGGTTSDSPAVSMTVSREFVENMPLNGRSFQDLIQLAPGAVAGTGSGGSNSGYYSINGQRTDSNNYTVDGVSANLGGINNYGGSNVGAGMSGSSPSQSVLGTTQSLVSIDSLQEFAIQTSGYSAEYGRTPGGQVQFTTRSGTNEIHGTAFEYLRNTAFDANTYYNNYFGDPQTAEHQNDFGGTVGGPIVIPRLYNGRERTFYFVSYEGLRLLLPSSESKYVPTAAFRQWVPAGVQPYVNAAPLPSPNSPGNQDGCTVPDPMTQQPTACDAHFSYSYSYPSSLDSTSARVDEIVSKSLHAFLRYANTPSSQNTGAEQVDSKTVNIYSWTLGVTANLTNNTTDDFRFNYSNDEEQGVYKQRAVGGSIPISRGIVIPAAYDSAYAKATTKVQIPSSSLSVGTNYGGIISTQRQLQLVDSLSWTERSHLLKVGIDWRRLTPTYSLGYASTVDITTLSDVEAGTATQLQVTTAAPGKPVFDNLSLYVEDHWKLRPTLSIDYGLRWEFNPPPGPSNGHYPAVLTSSNLATASLASAGTPAYTTRYNHFAPRFGFAWNAIPSRRYALTIRGGVGMFYDTGQSVIGNAYTNTYPFQASGPVLKEVPLPLSTSSLAPPSLNFPITAPYPYLNGAISTPELTLPYAEQWNLSLDEALNEKNTLTLSYVGNNGRKLLFTQAYSDGIPGNAAFPNEVSVTSNASQSSYNALQIQDTGRIANGLDLVASFTFAHSLDNVSGDDNNYGPQWGSSDNDIRRALNLALNYQVPSANGTRWIEAFTHGWLLANRFSTQSGYPINIQEASVIVLPNGGEMHDYPDLVHGVPIYLHGRAADFNGKAVPGSWRLNRAAFACTTTGATSGPCTGTPTRQGTLGRNFIRNPSFWALNTAVQRTFPIYERLHLNFRAEAFNLFNHPNLTAPDSTVSDTTFGQMVFGSETTLGSSNQLYSMGAARSLQLSLHLQF